MPDSELKQPHFYLEPETSDIFQFSFSYKMRRRFRDLADGASYQELLYANY